MLSAQSDRPSRAGASAGLILVAALASLLAGCANRHHIIVGSTPDDYRTNHPIIVSENEETLDVPVASGDRRLTYAAKGAVRGFAAEYRATASGLVRIMVPSGSPNSVAASLVAEEIADVLKDEGVLARDIVTTRYVAHATGDAAPIRLSFHAITAEAGPCGRWPEDILADTSENRHYENFGCATQSNLAAQVANPMDLIAPRGMTPIDTERRTTAIEDYRENGMAID